jgi:CRISPR-associated endonuclease Csn1
MAKIWGFDLGVTSIGFAVVAEGGAGAAAAAGQIERLGVRIFPEAREADRDRAPKNAARRQARLARRQLRRRRWRRVHMREILSEAGLLADERAEPPGGQDPYALRARGLREALSKNELGWALFHLLKRRGFAGSRKHGEKRDEDKAKGDKEGKTKAEKDEEESQAKAASLASQLQERKLGQYLAGIESTVEVPQRRRGVGQTRGMVTDELEALWQKQAEFHLEVLTPALRDRIERVALWQRPTYFRRRSIGQCDLETGQERALKADWLTQHFETLQLINGLRLEAGNQRGLDEGERALALAYLHETVRPTWAGLRKALGLPREARFTHERGKKETVRGNATEAALRRALGAEFPAHPMAQAIRDAIGVAWHLIEYRPARGGSVLEIRDLAAIGAARTELASRAVAEWGLSPDAARRLAAIELPDGTARHSVAAMRKMLPRLEAGQPYMTALRECYTVRESGEPLAFLPGPNMGEVDELPDGYVKERMESLLAGLRNPTVLRTLGELQKVVNTLIRVHGKPDLIRLEMARELKQSAKERGAADKYQADREKLRAAARAKVRELGRPAEGKDGEENVLRILLWQEQGGRCPFTGEQIGCADALAAAVTEIEHVFPRSRSLDDSQANKVLCRMQANRAKGNRTPFEWLAEQPEHWLYLTETVWPQMRASGWPESKRQRCLRREFEDAEGDGFTNRQLVDTSYIARAARDYLGLLFGGGQAGLNAVQVVPGRATAQLRRAWSIGLSRLLHGDVSDGPKIRDDHRHHAIDALTVALTSPATVKRLSGWWQVRETQGVKPVFPSPWEGFHAQAKAAVEAIVVSHRVQAKLSGALHEETRLGDTGQVRENYRLYAKRKPVAALTAGDVGAIRDAAVRKAVQDAVAAAGGNLKKGLASEIRLPRKDGTPGPVIRRVRMVIPRADGVMRLHPVKNIHAELGPGSLACMEIFENDGAVSFKIITRREAMAAARKAGDAAGNNQRPKLVLRPCDVLHRKVDGKDEYRLITKFYTKGPVFFRPLTAAIVDGPARSQTPGPLLAEGWRKVSVDPIGQVRAAR